MPMGSNRFKFSSYPRKRQAGFKSVNNPSDDAILSMSVDSKSLFRRSAQRLLPRRENKHIDGVFQALLSEANRELASLLRDVRTESDGTSPGDTRGQPISELLMRAVRCAAKQYMLQAELGNLALTDELTGLHNRRGFMALAERQLKLGRRSGRGMLLFVMDVDRLKQHSSAGSAPKFQLAFCQGHKAATVVQASEFVGERKIAQFCLQHVLLGGAADSAHQQLADRLTPSVTGRRAVRLRAHVSQQTCEFSVCFREEGVEDIIRSFLLSAR